MNIYFSEQENINNKLNNISKRLKNIPNIGNDYIEYFSAIMYALYENKQYLNEVSVKQAEYIIYMLDKTLEEIRKKEGSKKLFSNIRFGETIYIESYITFKEIIMELSELIIELEDLNRNTKMILAEALDYIIIKSAENNQVVLKNGEFYTPKQIVKVMVDLLDIKEKMAVYNPACGTGNFIAESAKNADIYAFGDEHNISNYNICMTNLWLNDIYNKRIKEDFREELQKVDIALSNPPFADDTKEDLNINNNLAEIYYRYGILPTTSNYIKYLVMMLESINEHGKISIVLPHGFLFKKAKIESYIRKYLVNNNYIEAIIGLPEKLFYNTKIPVIILMINKLKKKEEILFVDASREFEIKRKNNILTVENQNKIVNTYKNYKIVPNYSNIVTIEDIRKNDYDLDIKKYVYIKEEMENIDEEKIKENICFLEKKKIKIQDEIENLIGNL